MKDLSVKVFCMDRVGSKALQEFAKQRNCDMMSEVWAKLLDTPVSSKNYDLLLWLSTREDVLKVKQIAGFACHCVQRIANHIVEPLAKYTLSTLEAFLDRRATISEVHAALNLLEQHNSDTAVGTLFADSAVIAAAKVLNERTYAAIAAETALITLYEVPPEKGEDIREIERNAEREMQLEYLRDIQPFT